VKYVVFGTKDAGFYTNLAAVKKIEVCSGEAENALRHNNAHIAILEGGAYRALRKGRNYCHLKEVYLPLDTSALCGVFLYGAYNFIRGRLIPAGIVTWAGSDGERRRFLKLKVHSKKRRPLFAYYPARWTALDFLKFLDSLKAQYVALRWHDKILHNEPMNDIDILIEDKDILKVRQGLDAYIGTKPVDMHSVSGSERQKEGQPPYLPPKIARRILENRVALSKEGGYKPTDQDYFFSLAYHAIVHKDAASGLPNTGKEVADPDNKFYKELLRLKQALHIDIGVNREALAIYLKESGWL
jgi:hypothetical protein